MEGRQQAYLYLVKRTDAIGYDEYDGAVVAATDPEQAIRIYPGAFDDEESIRDEPWHDPEHLEVECLAPTDKEPGTIILSSFNAG